MRSAFRTLRAGRSDRDEARLRMAAAMITSVSAGLYALARPGPLSIVVSLAVVAAGIAWARRSNSALARSSRAASLTLDETGIERREGENVERAAWSEMTRIELDEDFLVVRVIRDGRDDLLIEPIYEGVSLEELAGAIDAARRVAKERPAAAPVSPFG